MAQFWTDRPVEDMERDVEDLSARLEEKVSALGATQNKVDDIGASFLNEITDAVFAFTVLRGRRYDLFIAEVAVFAVNAVARVMIALWTSCRSGTELKTGLGSKLRFVAALLLGIIEPIVGHELLMTTIQRTVSGGPFEWYKSIIVPGAQPKGRGLLQKSRKAVGLVWSVWRVLVH